MDLESLLHLHVTSAMFEMINLKVYIFTCIQSYAAAAGRLGREVERERCHLVICYDGTVRIMTLMLTI